MSQSTNVITIQQRMHKLYPSFVITKYHTPQEMTHSIYIYIKEQTQNESPTTKQNRNN